MEAQIKSKLETAFGAGSFTLVNDSEKHKDHIGHPMTGETHFRVTITSDVFEGKNRVERQRMVYDVLAEEFRAGLHALNIKALSTGEIKNTP